MEKFHETIRDGTHLLYFGATWCKNCSSIKKELVEHKYDVQVHLYDADEDEEEAAICGVTTLPQIQIWQDSKWVISYFGKKECEIGITIYRHFTEEYVQNVDTEEDF